MLQSAVLGFGIFRVLERYGITSGLSVAENVILQTTSVATATMPLAAGQHRSSLINYCPSSTIELQQSSLCNFSKPPGTAFRPKSLFYFCFSLSSLCKPFKSINLPACRQCTTPAGTLSAYPRPKGGHLKTPCRGLPVGPFCVQGCPLHRVNRWETRGEERSHRGTVYTFGVHVAGLVGIIPALGILTPRQNPPLGPIVLSPGQLLLWSLGLAFFGVFMAVPLRTQTIIKVQLVHFWSLLNWKFMKE